MPTGRAGQFNIQGIQSPGPYIIANPPAPVIAGVPTNIEAMVGVGSWGLVNSVLAGSTPSDCTLALGPPIDRPGDIATHVSAASQLGGAVAFRWVRVTDSTDTAATYTLAGGAGTLTARCTGTLGNGITATFQRTGTSGAYAAIVSFPGSLPERFDNIWSGLQSVAVTAGAGYTSVPAAAVTAPQKSGGTPATLQPTLTAVGTPTLVSGGVGHVANDVVTLGAGVQIKVLTVTGGAIATFSVQNPGLIASGAVPATVGQQTSSTGAGTGAAFTLSFGLGAPVITYGSGYATTSGNPITVTLSGGGATTAGSYAAVTSFWAALATAVNAGTPQRGRSGVALFSPGTSTAAPTLGTPVTLSGGTDGANGVGTAQLVGVDSAPGTGMYALRGSGMDTFQLCDCTDSTIDGALTALAIQESAYALTTTAKSDTVQNAIATRLSVGQDDTNLKVIVGDWPSMYIQGTGVKLVSPCAVAQGLFGNLSPEQSPINKALIGVVGTQSSQMGLPISTAVEDIAETGGIDIIGKSTALGVDYFSFLTGRNSSSNTIANGDEYVRMTNFLIKSYLRVGRTFVGKLQSQRRDDPTRTAALQAFDSFCSSLVDPSSGSGGYGMIDGFLNICDFSNNSPALIQRGYLFLTSKVQYLAVVRFFVVNLFGGTNVNVTVSTTNPGQVSF